MSVQQQQQQQQQLQLQQQQQQNTRIRIFEPDGTLTGEFSVGEPLSHILQFCRNGQALRSRQNPSLFLLTTTPGPGEYEIIRHPLGHEKSDDEKPVEATTHELMNSSSKNDNTEKNETNEEEEEEEEEAREQTPRKSRKKSFDASTTADVSITRRKRQN